MIFFQVLRYFMKNMCWKKKYLLLIVFVSVMQSAFGGAAIDSVGLQKKNNKWFIKHEIAGGETFYQLSNTYGVEIEDIMRANRDVTILSIDQIVLIPYSDLPYFIHLVKESETIYSICKRYGIEEVELNTWNNLSGSNLRSGDRLKINRVGDVQASEVPPKQEWIVHVVIAGESLYGISKLYSVEIDSLKAWNYLNSNDIQEGMYLRFKEGTAATISTEVVEPENTPLVVSDTSFEQNDLQIEPPFQVIPLPLFEERGMAALIEGSEGNQKYLALHRNAPTGTILLVRNELNNQMVFVRVIGQLPDTGTNDKLVVKVSEAAWKNVHAVNNRFRVKVSYFK